MKYSTLMLCLLFFGSINLVVTGAAAQQVQSVVSGKDLLTDQQWRQLDDSVKRGMAWLASQQRADGSFASIDDGQPAITALCVMAMLAQGEKPGHGKYGDVLLRAVSYIVAQQKPNGLIALNAPGNSPIPRNVPHDIGHPTAYNHAIGALALTEVYGHVDPKTIPQLTDVIEKAIAASEEMHAWKRNAAAKGGWRYLDKVPNRVDADLSVTGWQLMFLRSARGAGFAVDENTIDGAIAFVERCYIAPQRSFAYSPSNKPHFSRCMAGAGILALAHAGIHHTEAASSTADWILQHPYERYNWAPTLGSSSNHRERYHYGTLLCSQAMYQLGGQYWVRHYPPVVKQLLDNQQRNGAWPADSHHRDAEYGSCYTTSLNILTLSVSNQLLPVFQR